MLNDLQKLRARLRRMCPAARLILKGSLLLSLGLLLLALLSRLLYAAGGDPYYRHLALDLLQAPVSILLVAVLASVCVEERLGQ